MLFYRQDGLTPLWYAAKNGHDKVVAMLITLGKANIDIQDKVRFTFIEWLCLA